MRIERGLADSQSTRQSKCDQLARVCTCVCKHVYETLRLVVWHIVLMFMAKIRLEPCFSTDSEGAPIQMLGKAKMFGLCQAVQKG